MKIKFSNEAIQELSDIYSYYMIKDYYIEDQCNCVKCREDVLKHTRSRNLSGTMLKFYKKHSNFVPRVLTREFYALVPFNKRTVFYDIQSKILSYIPIIIENNSYNDPCSICGEPNTTGLINGSLVCEECKSVYFNECKICNKLVSNYSILNLDGEKDTTICIDCLNKPDFIKCTSCGKLLTINKYKTLPKTFIKTNNYRHVLHGDVSITKDEGLYFCTDCAAKSMSTCKRCGVDYIYRGGELCDRCDIFHVPIHRYDYKPEFSLYYSKSESINHKNKLYYGVELEFEQEENKNGRTTASNKVRGCWPEDFLYCVHDGSLESRDLGFELVSMPFTWKHFLENKYYWDLVLKTVYDLGFRGDSMPHAGCHIHLSKNKFTTFHLYKFSKFIFDPENRKFIKYLSNRSDPNNDEYWSFDTNRHPGVKSLAKEKYNTFVNNHYNFRRTAINITKNTVEFRLFQSTTNFNIFQRYLEICKSLYSFTRDYSPKDLTPIKYNDFLLLNGSLYPEVISFINKKPEILLTLDEQIKDIIKKTKNRRV